MERQTYRGSVQWLVVDDGKEPIKCTLGQEYIRREPQDSDPAHTLPLNLSIALPRIKADRVIFIEDDDWYSPKYLATTMARLDEFDPGLMALGYNEIYYYWVDRRYQRKQWGRAFSSLSSTALWQKGIDLLDYSIKHCNGPWVDCTMWMFILNKCNAGKLIHNDDGLILGFKGLPGKRGAFPHKAHRIGMKDDFDLLELHKRLGVEANAYEDLLDSREVAVATLADTAVMRA